MTVYVCAQVTCDIMKKDMPEELMVAYASRKNPAFTPSQLTETVWPHSRPNITDHIFIYYVNTKNSDHNCGIICRTAFFMNIF